MASAAEDSNRRMLRARDAMDRAYAKPLDVPALARIAHVSPAHFARTYRKESVPADVPTCFTMAWTRPSA